MTADGECLQVTVMENGSERGSDLCGAQRAHVA